jgi:hypothetical protein
VLPSCGLASFAPASRSGLVMSGLTTRKAPPEVAPEMILIASPPDWAKALMAGLGPM